MPYLFLVLLNAIKERNGKERSAQERPPHATPPPKHFGTHQSSQMMNNARNTATVDEMTKPRGQLSVLSPPSTTLQGPRKIPLSVLRWGSLNLLVLLWPVWCDGLSPFLFLLLLGGWVLSFGHPVVSPILSCVQLSPS